MCLFEKRVPFKIKWLNLALMDQKQPSYLKLNPTGLVRRSCTAAMLSSSPTSSTNIAFTLADIALAPRVDMFAVVGLSDVYQRFPRIGKFMKRVKERPSWTASGLHPEPGETERVVEAAAA